MATVGINKYEDYYCVMVLFFGRNLEYVFFTAPSLMNR
jgi:hypothetical protein